MCNWLKPICMETTYSGWKKHKKKKEKLIYLETTYLGWKKEKKKYVNGWFKIKKWPKMIVSRWVMEKENGERRWSLSRLTKKTKTKSFKFFFFFFSWWPGFEPRTLHILCIVPTNWAKLTRTHRELQAIDYNLTS